MVPTNDVPIAATDGLRIYYNPPVFFAKRYSVENRAFAIAHEVMHYVYNDCNLIHIWMETGIVQVGTRRLPFNNFLMGLAADYSINALLIHSKIGQFHRDWLYDPSLSKDGVESQVEVYGKLYDKLPPLLKKLLQMQAKRGAKNQGEGDIDELRHSLGVPESGTAGTPTQFDQHLAPGEGQGEEPAAAIKARNENEVKIAVAAAAAAAKAQGKLPAGLQRFITEVLNPKVPWQEELKILSMRRAGADGLDWTELDEQHLCRPDPYEMIAWPKETAYGCGTLVIGGDTSGSIDQKLLNIIMAEASGVVRSINPRKVYVVWCDAEVGRLDELEEPEDLELYRLHVAGSGGVKGGGGTDFRPVFNKVKELGITPDCLIYFTDLYGTFPREAPPYPTIWGALTDVKPPFGDVVRVEVK
jgi:predicted metal-dependent peptidase